MRSPLRYPGGKSRAVRHLLPLIPHKVDVASPFVGGASLEIALSDRGTRVYGYDRYKPLVSFWRFALAQPGEMAREARSWLPLTRRAFYEMQRNLVPETKGLGQAVAFFVLNRASYSGCTLSGGMSPGHPRFTPSACDRLRDFSAPLLSVRHMGFEKSIARNTNEFLYCDPPYAVESRLYGTRGDMHEGFDHEGLARLLMGRGGWLLSYNDCEMVRDLYAGCEFIPAKWAYGMNASRRSNEVVVRRLH